MIVFSDSEIKFLSSLEEGRLATSHDNIPHVKPVSFIFDNDSVIVATDYNTRTFKNIKENPVAAISIDIYKPGGHKAVCMQGTVEIIENGSEFARIYQMFFEKFQWVRNDPWNEDEAPFLKIVAKNKSSWGLKDP